jgi:hypothetical protein
MNFTKSNNTFHYNVKTLAKCILYTAIFLDLKFFKEHLFLLFVDKPRYPNANLVAIFEILI